MVQNNKWNVSTFSLILIMATSLRSVLSKEVGSRGAETYQSVDRRLSDILNERVKNLMTLESQSKEGLPVPVIKPESEFQLPHQKTPLKSQEGQQGSHLINNDLQHAASDHSHHKKHASGFKKSSGHDGNSRFKNSKGYEENQHGSHAKKEDKGFYDKGGKKWSGGEHKSKFHAKKKSGKKGSKGHKKGTKGHDNKGKKTKGFKNVFHKEESGVTSSFYNDVDNKKYSKKYDHLDSYFQSKKGGSDKGSEFKGSKHHGSDEKKGFFKKGSKNEDKGGHKSEFGKGAHHDHKTAFAEKKDNKKGYGGNHDEGHASHSNKVTIAASIQPIEEKLQDKSDLATAEVHGDMAIAEQNEIRDTKVLKSQSRNKIGGRRKKSREQNTLHDSQSADRDKSASVLEATVIKNGRQLSVPLSQKVGNNTNETFSFQVKKLIGSWPELKMFQTSDSDDSQPDRVIITTPESPKMELVVRKKTPHSKAYSYIKKSSTPLFSNCSSDGSNECTTYTKNSRSTVVVEYTDSDYPENQDDSEIEYSDYEQQPDTMIVENSGKSDDDLDLIKVAKAEASVKSANSVASAPDVTTVSSDVPKSPITNEALLLLLAQLQKAQLLLQTSATPKNIAVLVTEAPTTVPMVTTAEPSPSAFEFKRRRQNITPTTITAATFEGQKSTESPRSSSILRLLQRRRNKLDDNNIQVKKLKKSRGMTAAQTKEVAEEILKSQNENANVTQNDFDLNSRLPVRDRSAFRERLAARRERLSYLIKLADEGAATDIAEVAKITTTPTTINVTETASTKSVLDKSPFLVPDEWDSRRLDQATTVIVDEKTTPRSRNSRI